MLLLLLWLARRPSPDVYLVVMVECVEVLNQVINLLDNFLLQLLLTLLLTGLDMLYVHIFLCMQVHANQHDAAVSHSATKAVKPIARQPTRPCLGAVAAVHPCKHLHAMQDERHAVCSVQVLPVCALDNTRRCCVE